MMAYIIKRLRSIIQAFGQMSEVEKKIETLEGLSKDMDMILEFFQSLEYYPHLGKPVYTSILEGEKIWIQFMQGSYDIELDVHFVDYETLLRYKHLSVKSDQFLKFAAYFNDKFDIEPKISLNESENFCVRPSWKIEFKDSEVLSVSVKCWMPKDGYNLHHCEDCDQPTHISYVGNRIIDKNQMIHRASPGPKFLPASRTQVLRCRAFCHKHSQCTLRHLGSCDGNVKAVTTFFDPWKSEDEAWGAAYCEAHTLVGFANDLVAWPLKK